MPKLLPGDQKSAVRYFPKDFLCVYLQAIPALLRNKTAPEMLWENNNYDIRIEWKMLLVSSLVATPFFWLFF